MKTHMLMSFAVLIAFAGCQNSEWLKRTDQKFFVQKLYQPPALKSGKDDLKIGSKSAVAQERFKPMIHQLNSRQHLDAIIGEKKPVLLDFYADWCGPCHKQSQELAALNLEQLDAHIVKIDVEKFPEIANQYKASRLPTLVLVDQGREIYKKSGLHTAAQVKDLFSR